MAHVRRGRDSLPCGARQEDTGHCNVPLLPHSPEGNGIPYLAGREPSPKLEGTCCVPCKLMLSTT